MASVTMASVPSGPDDELGEVVAARRLHVLPAAADHLTGAQHGFDAEHLVAGHAVLHGPHAAGVGGHVAAEAGAVLAREHRVDEAVDRGGGIELVEGDTGLHDGDVVLEVDLEDLGHVLERHQDPAVAGDARTREPGAAAPGRDRYAQLGGDAHDRRDLGAVRRSHHDVGSVRRRGERLVVGEVLADRLAMDDRLRTDDGGQPFDQVPHGNPPGVSIVATLPVDVERIAAPSRRRRSAADGFRRRCPHR